ncbi:MAG: Phosphoglycerate mutase family protein, partial [uncultured Acidimicrobiales bacterium]
GPYCGPAAPHSRPARPARPDPDHRQAAPRPGARPAPVRDRRGPGRRRRPAAGHPQEGRRDLRLAARAHQGDGRRHRQGTGAQGQARQGPARGRHRRLDRPGAQDGAQDARMEDRPLLSERLPVPGRRVVRGDADPHRLRHRTAAAGPPRPDHRGRVPRGHHQGGRRPRPGHPPRPVPAHRDLALLRHVHRLRRRRARRAVRQLLGRRPRTPTVM